MVGTLLVMIALANTARVVDASGVVERIGTDGVAHAVGRGSALEDSDRVRTGNDGHARLLVNDAAVVDLAPGSELHIDAAQGHTRVKLGFGRLWARVSHLFGDNSFTVETSSAVAGVRGTSFFTEVEGDTTTVSVEAGAVEVTNGRGERAMIGVEERVRADSRTFSRTRIQGADLAALHDRIATRERDDRDEGALRRGLAREVVQGDGARSAAAREAIREAMKLRRDTPLDIDPGQAKRYLERLRALRERRRLNR